MEMFEKNRFILRLIHSPLQGIASSLRLAHTAPALSLAAPVVSRPARARYSSPRKVQAPIARPFLRVSPATPPPQHAQVCAKNLRSDWC